MTPEPGIPGHEPGEDANEPGEGRSTRVCVHCGKIKADAQIGTTISAYAGVCLDCDQPGLGSVDAAADLLGALEGERETGELIAELEAVADDLGRASVMNDGRSPDECETLERHLRDVIGRLSAPEHGTGVGEVSEKARELVEECAEKIGRAWDVEGTETDADAALEAKRALLSYIASLEARLHRTDRQEGEDG